ncbi:hypothetical protein GCM10010222_73560 [Streptomyces tanashiensis]|uniref:hypothetical protein n=1 Tax=Streptomyces tanashiensis TaxID=67367 RepID=UPI001672A8FB|nr:hypothetical protein [Streptomyces tanashiensis]GGT20927.1 hypothetical protein GCM10010222_73560 [Streptomyces tanashiensis]
MEALAERLVAHGARLDHLALRALDGTDALVLPEFHRLVGPRPTPGGSHHPAPGHRSPYEAPGARDHRDF